MLGFSLTKAPVGFFRRVADHDNRKLGMRRILSHRRIGRLLTRRGVAEEVGEAGADRWHEEAPVLAAVAAASVQGRRALGERAGARMVRHDASDELPAFAVSGLGPCHARWRGYDLHANVCVGRVLQETRDRPNPQRQGGQGVIRGQEAASSHRESRATQ